MPHRPARGGLAGDRLPLIPGHEIVSTVEATGTGADQFSPGVRVSVHSRLHARRLRILPRRPRGRACAQARFTGYQIDGGYAEYTVADQRYCLPCPDIYSDVQAAPLLCAGLIGYRALRMATASVSNSMASAPRRISCTKWHAGMDAACSRSPARATPTRRTSHANSARCGLAGLTNRLELTPMPPSSLPRSDRWCPPRCARWSAAAPWSAPAPHEPDSGFRTISVGRADPCAPSPA